MTSLADNFPSGVPTLTWTRTEGTTDWQGNAAGTMRIGSGAGTDTQIAMRCTSALATVDQAVSCTTFADRACPAGTVGRNGPIARVTGSSFYEAVVQFNDTQAFINLNRVVATARTLLVAFTNLGPWDTVAHKITLKVAQTASVHLEVLKDDVSLGTFTDTNAARIQTGNLAGVSMRNGFNAALIGAVDNWTAADFTYVPPIKNLAAKVSIASSAKQGVVLLFR